MSSWNEDHFHSPYLGPPAERPIAAVALAMCAVLGCLVGVVVVSLLWVWLG